MKTSVETYFRQYWDKLVTGRWTWEVVLWTRLSPGGYGVDGLDSLSQSRYLVFCWVPDRSRGGPVLDPYQDR